MAAGGAADDAATRVPRRGGRRVWRIAGLAVLLLAAYAALGYGLVPWLVRTQVPARVAEATGHRLALDAVRFDPFALRLEVSGLTLADPSGAPLATVGALVTDLEWSSVARRAWHFALLRIEAPHARLAIEADGRFNLARFIDAWRSEPSTDDALPRLLIDRLELARGRADFDDRRAGYRNSLAPIDMALDNLSTLPDHKGPYTLAADTARGGRIRWKGEASLNPIRGSGTLVLEAIALPELAAYLKPWVEVALDDGRFAASLPYRFSYSDGKPGFDLDAASAEVAALKGRLGGTVGAGFALGRLELAGVGASLAAGTAHLKTLKVEQAALTLPGAKTAALDLPALTLEDLKANRDQASVDAAALTVTGARVAVRRDARGVIDWQAWLGRLAAMTPAPATPPAQPVATAAPAAPPPWRVTLARFAIDKLALGYTDLTAPGGFELGVARASATGSLALGANGTVALKADLGAADVAAGPPARPALRLAELGVGGLAFTAPATLAIDRVVLKGPQAAVRIDAAGRPDLLAWLPGPGTGAGGPAASPGTPAAALKVAVKSVEVSALAADVEDAGSGIRVRVQEGFAKLAGVSADPARAVGFEAGLQLREGGSLRAKGRVVPVSGALDAAVRVERLALAITQPLLARFVKLRLASGEAAADGRLVLGAKDARVRYTGSAGLANLALVEADGKTFAALGAASAEGVALTLGPDALEIADLRLDAPKAQLLIAADRSLNAARLLVDAQPAGAAAGPGAARVASPGPTPMAAPVAAPVAASAGFPVTVRRLRIARAELDFEDLSLKPPFGAKIHELAGVVTGLSTSPATRSRLELDGRVDEFGLARIRGEFNPFFPRVNTDVAVVFRNVDMTSASPYAMKFAGYRIASGRISLDLGYKVRDGQLQGDNQVTIDKLTLGERVDSPDALNLPLELAIAILKDADGRIDLGLPVSGSLDDPQFSYGAVIWKAVVNVLTRIVTAPFRALGALFGGDGEKLESVDFDPGSARLTPPEREKLRNVAQVLQKRAQLRLAVPGAYSEAADAPVLRERALRTEVLARAGVRLAAGEAPGPLDLADRAQRIALRALFVERFGAAGLERLREEAERGSLAGAAPAAKAPPALPLWRKALNLAQGEPNVPDAEAYHAAMASRLAAAWPLPADALAKLATERSAAVAAALGESGVDPARVTRGAVGPAEPKARMVPLKLGLAAR